MTLELKYAEKIQQGREERTLEVVRNMMGHNMAPEVIAIAINEPMDETMRLIEQMKGAGE